MFVAARSGNSELETIQDRYMNCLRTFIEHTNPQQMTRFQNLLDRMPEVSVVGFSSFAAFSLAREFTKRGWPKCFQVQSAAALLLESKMFYVPFLLNSTIQR